MADKTQKKETKKQEYKRKFNNAIKAQQRLLNQLKKAGIEAPDLTQSFRPKEYRAGSANRVKADTQRMKAQYGQALAEATNKKVVLESGKTFESTAVKAERKRKREERAEQARTSQVKSRYREAVADLKDEIIKLKEQGYEVSDDVVELSQSDTSKHHTTKDVEEVREVIGTITERAWKPDKEGNLVTKAQTDEARAEKARITRERNRLTRKQKIAKIKDEGRAAGYDLGYIMDIIVQYDHLPDSWDALHNMYIAETSTKSTSKYGLKKGKKKVVAIVDPFDWIKRSLNERFGWNDGQQSWNTQTGKLESLPTDLASRLSKLWEKTLKTARDNGYTEWLADWISQQEYALADCFDTMYAASDEVAILQAFDQLLNILTPFDYIAFDERAQLEEMFDEYNYSEEDYI